MTKRDPLPTSIDSTRKDVPREHLQGTGANRHDADYADNDRHHDTRSTGGDCEMQRLWHNGCERRTVGAIRRASSSFRARRSTASMPFLIHLLLSSLLLPLGPGNAPSAALASELCSDPDEAVRFRRVAPSSDGSRCCDTFTLEGIDTACHFHFYTRSEALSCLAGKHVIVFGGSVQSGVAMNLMQLLKPAESYPVDPDEWLNCPGCGLQTSPIMVALTDLVLDGDGNVVSVQTMKNAKLEGFDDGGSIPDLDSFLSKVQSSTGGGATPGGWDGVRVTYANVRYYDDVVKVAKYILNAYNGNDGGDSTSDRYEPVLWLGIRGWWYEFCSQEYIDSDTDYCVRDDLRYLPRSTIFAKAAEDVGYMVDDIRSDLPAVKSVLMDGDEYLPDYQWNIDATKSAIAGKHPFVFVRNDGPMYSGGITNDELWQRSHPNNKNYQMRLSRMLAFGCGMDSITRGAASATGETIRFLTGGCVDDTSNVIDSSWANHFFQPCHWESELEGVTVIETTTEATTTTQATTTTEPPSDSDGDKDGAGTNNDQKTSTTQPTTTKKTTTDVGEDKGEDTVTTEDSSSATVNEDGDGDGDGEDPATTEDPSSTTAEQDGEGDGEDLTSTSTTTSKPSSAGSSNTNGLGDGDGDTTMTMTKTTTTMTTTTTSTKLTELPPSAEDGGEEMGPSIPGPSPAKPPTQSTDDGLPLMEYALPRSWDADAVSYLRSTHISATSLTVEGGGIVVDDRGGGGGGGGGGSGERGGEGEDGATAAAAAAAESGAYNGPLSRVQFQLLLALLSAFVVLYALVKFVYGEVKVIPGGEAAEKTTAAAGPGVGVDCPPLPQIADKDCGNNGRAVTYYGGVTATDAPVSLGFASFPPVGAIEPPRSYRKLPRGESQSSRLSRPIQVEELPKAADDANNTHATDPSLSGNDGSRSWGSAVSFEAAGLSDDDSNENKNVDIEYDFSELGGSGTHFAEGRGTTKGEGGGADATVTGQGHAQSRRRSRESGANGSGDEEGAIPRILPANSSCESVECKLRTSSRSHRSSRDGTNSRVSRGGDVRTTTRRAQDVSDDARRVGRHAAGPVDIDDVPSDSSVPIEDTFEDDERPREEYANEGPHSARLAPANAPSDGGWQSSSYRLPVELATNDKAAVPRTSSPAGESANSAPERPPGLLDLIAIPKPGGKRAPALGFARFVASVYIVAGHIVRKPGQQMIPNWATNQYGYTWVPWFMMLSGFILSFARLRSRNPDKLDKWYLFTAKRVKSIYPLYLTGLLTWAAVDAYLTQTRFSLGTPFETVASLLLIQAWIPSITEHVVQPHCWFLSCIVPYWMLHNFMYAKSKKWSTKVICVVLAVLTVLPWIAIVVVPVVLGNLYWFKAHEYYGTGTAVDTLVVMLKYHPLCYWHTYLYGVLCAHLCVRFKDKPPFLLKFGSSWGYAGLFIIFAISPWARFPADELSFRLGVLSPFQGAGLIGLTLGLDPVAQIFGVPILACLGELSYPQYVFQFIAFVFFADATNPFGYWAFLMALSIIGYVWIQNPLKDWNVKRKTTYVYSSLAMVALPGVLVALLLLYVGVPKRNDMDSLPDKVKYSSTAQDMRLNFEAFSDARRLRKGGLPRIHPDAPADAHVNFINPSLLYVESDDSFLLTARRHLFVSTTEKGPFDVPVIDGRLGTDDVADWKTTTTWYSDIVVGGAGWDDRRKRDGFFISTLKTLAIDEPSCNTTYRFTRANRTLSVLVRLGPEDPRLIRHADGELGVTFNHLPIAQEQDSEVRVDKVCTEESVMYSLDLAGSDEELLYDEGKGSTMQPIDDPLFIWDIDRVPTVKEKNWIGVVHPEKGTYFIKNLYPYSICHLAVDTGVCEYVSAPSNPVMKSLYQNGYKVHGGSNAIFLDQGVLLSEEESASGPKYLAAIHAIDEHGRYLNYLVELEGESPFQIVRVSAPLPLLEAPALDGSTSRPLAFVSGLTVVNRRGGTDNDAYSRFFVSYGSSNMESRVLELSGADVAYLFGAEEVSVVVPSSPGSSNDIWGAQGNKEDFLDYMEWSNSPPGGLNPDQVPMFVSLGFDDNGIAGFQDEVSGTGGMTWAANFFRSLRNPAGRGNPGTYDGTPARVSFFATTFYIDEWFKESPAMVKKSWRTAYEDGHEFGSHMHRHNNGFNFTETQWKDEIVQSVDLISRPFDAEESVGDPEKEKGIGIPASELVGFRAPYLSYNAELYSSLEELGFLYDCSIAEGWQGDEDGTNFAWPYTLDNGSKGHDYALNNGFPGKVPLGSYKGLWEIPAYAIIIPPDEVAERYGIESGLRDRIKNLMPWFGVEDGKLTGFDYNLWVEAKVSKEEFLATLKYTLDMRLQGNRAPFTLGVHTDYYSSEWYFEAEANAKAKERQEAIEEFITYALSLPEVRVVPHQAILDWIRNPNREVL